MHRRTVLIGLCLVAVSPGFATARDDGFTLRFDSPGKAAREIPIAVTVTPPAGGGNISGYYTLLKIGGDKHLQSNAVLRRDGERGWLIEAVLTGVGEGPNSYTLRPRALLPEIGSGRALPVEFHPAGPNVEMLVNGEPFATYRVDDGPKPFLWPLIGPGKIRYTRAFPMEKVAAEDADHPHQRSLWFTYGMANGVDFWAEQKGHGSIKETSRKFERTGLVVKSLKTTDDWLGSDGEKILQDERTLTVWGTMKNRVLDLDVTLKATEGPVKFGDTKEGMFGLRVPSSMDVKAKKGGKIVNAQGLIDGAAWGKRSSWVDYSGPVDGKTVGITILEHPTSYGSPTPWHVRDYGLFAANPFGRHDFGLADKPTPTILPKGESFTFRYRVILHEGDAQASDPATAFEFYAKPPKMTLTRD